MPQRRNVADSGSKIGDLVIVSLASPGHPVATSSSCRSVVVDLWPAKGCPLGCALVGCISRRVSKRVIYSAIAEALHRSVRHCWRVTIVILSDDDLRNSCSVVKYSKAFCQDLMVNLDRRAQPHESLVVFVQFFPMRWTCISECVLAQDQGATACRAWISLW